MSPLLQTAALLCTALGVLSATAVLASRRAALPAVRVLLEFLLAAGLLRLADEPGWPQLATAAAIVALRRVLSSGVRSSARRAAMSR